MARTNTNFALTKEQMKSRRSEIKKMLKDGTAPAEIVSYWKISNRIKRFFNRKKKAVRRIILGA